MRTATIVAIDTALPETVVVLISNDRLIDERRSIAARRADDLLSLIDELVQSADLTLPKLSAIVVRRGLGSYTGLRVGVTVATTLAWSLRIPVIGVVSRKPLPLTIQQVMRALQKSDLPARRRYASSVAGGRPLTSDLRPLFPIYGRWPTPQSPARLTVQQ